MLRCVLSRPLQRFCDLLIHALRHPSFFPRVSWRKRSPSLLLECCLHCFLLQECGLTAQVIHLQKQGRPWIMPAGNLNKLKYAKKCKDFPDSQQRKHAKIKTKRKQEGSDVIDTLHTGLNKWHFILSKPAKPSQFRWRRVSNTVTYWKPSLPLALRPDKWAGRCSATGHWALRSFNEACSQRGPAGAAIPVCFHYYCTTGGSWSYYSSDSNTQLCTHYCLIMFMWPGVHKQAEYVFFKTSVVSDYCMNTARLIKLMRWGLVIDFLSVRFQR